MGNEQNALALCCQVLHDLHRSKYCGRLIKDQDLVVTVKHFQDLGSLLHTYCGILDNGIRIYRKTIFFGKGHNLFTRALFLKETVFCGLNAKDNIIQNTEAFYQFEMLMYHSNAQVICIVWIFDFNFLSLFDSGKTLGYSQHFNCIFTHLRFLLFSWQSRRQKAQVIKRLLITSFTKNLSSEQYYKSYYDGTYVKKGSGHCSLPFFSLHGHSSC